MKLLKYFLNEQITRYIKVKKQDETAFEVEF
jgi:hypothetical protein